MSKTPNYDEKIKVILDATKPGERICELTGEKWEMTEEEISWYRKFNVPPSKKSPNTRWKILAYFSTGFQFWWNKHFYTGEPILTFHHPATGVRVLPDKEWLECDFSSISFPFNINQSFFDQLYILTRKIPYRATYDSVPPEHSISIVSFGDQYCYFTLGCKGKKLFYSTSAINSENSSLLFGGHSVINSHSILYSSRIFQCQYLRECFDCMDSCFLFDCRNCQYCFGAANKRNRKYLWWNEQLSKEEWEKRRAQVDLGRRSVIEACEQKFEKLLLKDTIWPENFNEKTTNSTGDHLNGSVNCHECYYSVDGGTNCFQTCYLYFNTELCFSCFAPKNSSRSYNTVSDGNTNNCQFCFRCFSCETCEYCLMCDNCQYCFGCVGLRHKQFYIFNRPYQEEDYWQKVDELKCAMLKRGEYGEFFPTKFSSTYGPESGSVVYCGCSIEEIEKIGPNNFDPNECEATKRKELEPTEICSPSDIPDSIDDLTDQWIGKPIYDAQVRRTFTFLKPEIIHYRELRIAPPTTHFIQRTNGIHLAGNLCGLEKNFCAQCARELLVAKSEKYLERKIYCKECYLKYLEERG